MFFRCQDMHHNNKNKTKNVIWERRFEEHDKNPNHTNFEKQCGQIITLDEFFLQITQCAFN